jgi:glycosyltransferase involved in cell wall biosynthesis
VTSTGARRLCVVTETYPPEDNGVALTLGQLVTGLRSRGHTVTLVRPRQARDAARAANGDVLVRGLPLPGYPGLRFGLPAGAALTIAWGERRPDAVYVATEGPLGWSAVRTAIRMRIPVLSGFHTNFDRYAGCYVGAWTCRTVASYLRRFHNRSDGTVVATAELARRLEATGFRQVSVVGRGVDTRLFDPARRSPELRAAWGAGDDDLVVLHVGRLAPEKNVPVAFDAYRAMQRAHARLRLVVVGDGPLHARLRAEQPDVIFCGLRTGESLAAHYASADIFLFPSETETFGNVVLEAMASGLAVVAYDYAAARAHITDGETGVLVPYRDARAFSLRAAAVTRHAPALHALRRRARAAMLPLDWPRIVERFERVLHTPSTRGGDR